MAPPIKLPVANEFSHETAKEDIESQEVKLNSIADSLVLLHSLRQSREFWLLSAFRKFSTKARGKQPAETFADPHYIKTIAKCEMEIGPHVFFDTAFFEVRYLPTTSPATSTNIGHTSEIRSAIQSQPAQPVVGSLDPSVEVTPALISQVNLAAATNPILQNLLQLAAAGRASHDQLKTLGILVQSLATQSNPYANPPPGSSNTEHGSTTYQEESQSNFSNSTSGPIATTQQIKSLTLSEQKPNDIVFEFRENGYDRWLFPKDVISCERFRNPETDQYCDIHLRFVITANARENSNSSLPPSSEDVSTSAKDKCAVVNLKVRKASTCLWEAFNNFFHNNYKEDVQRTKQSSRVFLQYQLQDSPLLTQLENTISHYSLKQLKPNSAADGSRSRRMARRKRLNMDDGASEGSQKFRKFAASKIACASCDAKNVPLLSGGRYCRQCLDKAPHSLAVIPNLSAS